MKSEIEEVCRLEMIEPSESPPYSSLLLMVKKKDGTNRPVVDFRRINKVTIFDAEPMPRADDIYERMANSRYLSTMDFCKLQEVLANTHAPRRSREDSVQHAIRVIPLCTHAVRIAIRRSEIQSNDAARTEGHGQLRR